MWFRYTAAANPADNVHKATSYTSVTCQLIFGKLWRSQTNQGFIFNFNRIGSGVLLNFTNHGDKCIWYYGRVHRVNVRSIKSHWGLLTVTLGPWPRSLLGCAWSSEYFPLQPFILENHGSLSTTLKKWVSRAFHQVEFESLAIHALTQSWAAFITLNLIDKDRSSAHFDTCVMCSRSIGQVDWFPGRG